MKQAALVPRFPRLIMILVNALLVGVISGSMVPAHARAGQACDSAEELPPDIRRIKERGRLIVVTPGTDEFPCVMTDRDGSLYGIDVDIANDIAARLGVGVELYRSAGSGDEMIEVVVRKEADMALCTGVTPARAMKVLYTKPYMTERYALLVNRLLGTRLGMDHQQVLSQGKGSIAHTKGSIYGVYAGSFFAKAPALVLDDRQQCYDAALRGDAFAFLIDEFEAVYHFHAYPEDALRLRTVFLEDQPIVSGIAVPWESSHFHSWLNLYLELSGHDPSADAIIRKYLR